MIGIIVELLLSWLLLRLVLNKDIEALGLLPKPHRVRDLICWSGIALAACFIYSGIDTILNHSHWKLNPKITPGIFFSAVWWVIVSVLFEELIFRGALLYILIKKTNAVTACLISACGFGIYHWFSFGAFGDPVKMIFRFLMTSIWGYMFAIAFVRTGSLYAPVGLHLGWNLAFIAIFSRGPIGQQLFINAGADKLTGFVSLIDFLSQVFLLPVIVWVYLRKKSAFTILDFRREQKI